MASTLGAGGGFGIAIPQIAVGRRPDPSIIAPFLARAEQAGFHSAWVLEHVALQPKVSAFTPISLLAAAAMVSSRIRLGCAVFLSSLHSPFQFARELATLDCLSGGRLIVGVGSGRKSYLYGAFGLSEERHVRRFEEGLRVMRMLWSQSSVTFEGDFTSFDQVGIDPRPVQTPLPVWFGAQFGNALRRTAQEGDGWIGSGDSTPEAFEKAAIELRQHCEEIDRDPATLTFGRRVYMLVGDDRASCRGAMREWFGRTYGNADVGELAGVYGRPEDCAEGLARLREMGSELSVIHPIINDLDQLEAIAEGVLPLLGASAT